MIKICPNCKTEVRLNEYLNHCPICGFVFINMIKRQLDTEERAHIHRTGDGVDQIDG